MSIVISLMLILGFIVVYTILLEVFTVLFRMTGIPQERARFQVISLITNSGFTTEESEIVVIDKKRRKIATSAMISGYVFSVIIVSLIINLFFSISSASIKESSAKIVIALSIAIGLMIILKLPFIRKPFDKMIEHISFKIMFKDKDKNQISIIDRYDNSVIAQIKLNRLPQFLISKTIEEAGLKKIFGLTLLALRNENGVLNTITKDTILKTKDTITLFGPKENIMELFDNKY